MTNTRNWLSQKKQLSSYRMKILMTQTANLLNDSRIKLSEDSISAIQTTKDGMNKFKNSYYKVP